MNTLAWLILAQCAIAAPTPRAQGDAAYALNLWQNGRAAFDASRWSEAGAYFERLTALYPADANALEAQRYLALTLLEDGKAAQSLTPLKRYVERKRGTAQAADASLDLGRAYLAVGKKHEAFLLSEELLRTAQGEMKIRALVLKTRSLIAMNRDERAEQAASSARKELVAFPSPSPGLQGGVAAVSLHIKLRACGRLPSAPKLIEEAAVAQMQRRGLCLQEALLEYEKVLVTRDIRSGREATELVRKSWDAYRAAGANPPGPAGDLPRARRDQYRLELSRRLTADIEANIIKSKDILNSLKDRLPSEMLAFLKEALP